MESLWVQTAISAIRVIAFVCDVITFPVYLVLQQPWKRRQQSKRIKVSTDFNLCSFVTFFFFLNVHSRVWLVTSRRTHMEKNYKYISHTK